MPIIRSRSPTSSRSRCEESTDWSMETPAESSTSGTTATESTKASSVHTTTARKTRAATNAEQRAAQHTEQRATQHAELRATQHTEPRATLRAEQRATQHTEQRATQHAEQRVAQHAELRATQHDEPRATPHAEHQAAPHAAPYVAPHDASHVAPFPAPYVATHVAPYVASRAEPRATPAAAQTVDSSAHTGTSRINKVMKNIGGSKDPPFASSETIMPAAPRSTRSSKRAELEARRELHRRNMELAQAAAALAQTELEIAQCNSEDDLDEEFEHEKSVHVERWVERSTSYVEPPKEEAPRNDIRELTEAIISATRMSAAPQKIWDLPDFNGAFEDWLPFKRAYEDTRTSFDRTQNMARLRKTIKGSAKEIVRSLLFIATDPEEIMKALERRFGKPEELVLLETEKIKELPRLNDNPRDTCVFASRVSNAVATIQALKKPQYLYSPELSRAIVEKLTPILRYRWYDFKSRREEDEPELLKLKTFLDMEADLCGDAVLLDSRKRFGRHQVHTTYEDSHSGYAAAPTQPTGRVCDACEGEHWITECRKFKDATINQRWEIVKQKRLCFKCLKKRHTKINCKGQPCKRCRRPHHAMLHADRPQPAPTQEAQTATPSRPQPTEDKEVVAKAVYAASEGAKAYLKMLPVEVYGSKGSARVLALLDEGSTVTLMDANVAKRIGAVGHPEALVLETVGGKIVEKKNSQRMDLKIKGLHQADRKTLRNVRTVEDLRLSSQQIKKEDLQRCRHLQEKIHELVYEDERPTLLIGQDNWDLIVSRKILKGRQNEPVASLTSLGWVLHGCGNISAINSVNHCSITHREECIEAMIKKHFELDALGIQHRYPSNDADEKALNILRQTVKRRPDGRFEAGLLWRTNDETLPQNYKQALNRLQGIEKKLEKNDDLKKEYSSQIKNLLKNGYAEEVPEGSNPGRTFYLPHFAVTHPTKKKIRIVFDAAAKFQGKSLNDALLTGPDLLQSLFGVLLRFRQGSYAIVADIKEMFLQIKIRKEDRDSLRFLWREGDDEGRPKEYRMTSVIFGAASSPATAIFVKNLNASEHEAEYPAAAAAIVRNHYMDDYLQSFDDIREATRTIKAVNEVHKAAGFELRQWASNSEEILRHVVRGEEAPREIALGKEEEKTLGMRWLVKEDALAFNIGLRNTPKEVISGDRAPTKREVTSAVMSTFDPMGLVAPVLIKGKRLIQEVWRTGSKWDEVIGDAQQQLWTEYVSDINKLKGLKIPRSITPRAKKGQLHTFVDASEAAYAAACYWRAETEDGKIHVKLIAGKARVAPVKSTSIPRLELQAALLGGRLAASITKELDLEITERIFWSDSSTVLQWLKSDPRRFKTFVAHRLAELEDITKTNEWRWVPSKDNPADDATRNVPSHFDSGSRWFIGPGFLYQPSAEWPKRRFEEAPWTGDEEKRKEVVTTIRTKERILPDPTRFSSWNRLLRTTARVFMFIDLCKTRKTPVNATRDQNWKPYMKKKAARTRIENTAQFKKDWRPIGEEHLQKAERALLRMSQEESFDEEIKRMKTGSSLDRSSKLKRIDITISTDGLLRLSSRTRKIKMVENRDMAPVILDGKHRIARLIVEHYHQRFLHGNHATVINEVRQKYWILGLRNAVKKIVHQCQWCKVRRTKPQTPITGDLPEERLHHNAHPFTCTAVDYFGPMNVTIGRRKEKRWGVLFTCLTTRAIHLELAASLSTSSMIMALRRMAARRGSPKRIYSDNGTNFVGADKELQTEWAKIDKKEIELASEEKNIVWKFIPPGAPHMGGAWERMIRTVKVALTAVLFEKSPPEEVLYTLLTEVEHTVNSRPLTHISSDPADEESLTPNHFLIGRSCGSAAVGDFNNSSLVGKANWKTAQLLADHFWKRWLREYLPTLMPRKLGREAANPEEGDIVIIADSSLPRNTWPRGEVVAAHRGPDGRVRVVDVRTVSGIMRRPTSRLIIVVPRAAASSPSGGVPGGACTGGETVNDAT